jgi:hypothetical protein
MYPLLPPNVLGGFSLRQAKGGRPTADVIRPIALIELASSRVTRFNDTSCWLEVLSRHRVGTTTFSAADEREWNQGTKDDY